MIPATVSPKTWRNQPKAKISQKVSHSITLPFHDKLGKTLGPIARADHPRNSAAGSSNLNGLHLGDCTTGDASRGRKRALNERARHGDASHGVLKYEPYNGMHETKEGASSSMDYGSNRLGMGQVEHLQRVFCAEGEGGSRKYLKLNRHLNAATCMQ